MGSIPELGRLPGEGLGNPLQYSCLENPMNRGAWRATVHRVSKSQIQLKQLSTTQKSMIYLYIFSIIYCLISHLLNLWNKLEIRKRKSLKRSWHIVRNQRTMCTGLHFFINAELQKEANAPTCLSLPMFR